MGLRLLLFCSILLSIIAPAAAFASEPPSAQDVRAALKRGVDYLYSKQKPDGSWEELPSRPVNTAGHGTEGGQWGGSTGLITYALLAAGEDPQDPRMQKAIEFLREADIIGTYALGVRAQIWLFLPKVEENLQAAQRDFKLLMAVQQSRPGAPNFWLFGYLPGANNIDISASQYGMLGIWASSELVEVPMKQWQTADKVWREQQQADGGWSYRGKPDAQRPTTPSMTAAGVATLFITQEYLLRDEGLNCKGNHQDPRLDAGLKFLAESFPGLVGGKAPPNRVNTPASDQRTYYTLYGIERVGVASGLKYLGEHDWYAEGSTYLLNKQRGDGSWGDDIHSSFCMLFLSRGSAPVMMNKLQYNATDRRGNLQEGPWNQRPRDVANAVRYTAKETEKTLNWQIINLGIADVRDLQDAPVLWVSGSDDLTFTDQDKAKLKAYVESGGLILGNADCRRRNFEDTFRKFGSELFPAYEWRILPDDHPIYDQQFKLQGAGRDRPVLMGLSNGVRELMLLIPRDDLGRTYQKVEMKDEIHFQIAANIFQYTIDKTHARLKGDLYVLDEDKSKSVKTTIPIARLKHGGNWDPEPAGWTRLSAMLRRDQQTALDIQPTEMTELSASKARIAHLTGTGRLALNDDQRKALADFINGGGVLIVDAAGGDGEFAENARTELAKILPGFAEGSKVADPSDPMLALNGKPMERVDYRAYTRSKLLGSLNAPRIVVYRVADKPAVVFSAEDLSGGLVGYEIDGIIGYEPQSAADLMQRIILNAAK